MSLPPHRVSFSYQDLRVDTIQFFSEKHPKIDWFTIYIYISFSERSRCERGPAAVSSPLGRSPAASPTSPRPRPAG